MMNGPHSLMKISAQRFAQHDRGGQPTGTTRFS
jgi:hypothetical protein